MSALKFEKTSMLTTPPLEESCVPSVHNVGIPMAYYESALNQDDEIPLHYGYEETFFPFRDQELYDRSLVKRDIEICVLENEYLRAEFLTEYGGRLWSLYDKQAQKELLFKNSAIRMANLAGRNAWFSGGVEWNCGTASHSVFGCVPLHVGSFTMDDGTPVLRLYQFERIRSVAYQMDFWLPKGSKALLCRMKIMHPGRDTIPMWWWSNAAVPEDKGSRVIINADEVYTDFDFLFEKQSNVLDVRGVDSTYPTKSPRASSYFWKIHKNARKYNCHIDKSGYGIAQVSTSRLVGRKLFVWGQGPGGDRWQNFLTADDEGGRYVEIQAGLGVTQGGCEPMPPNTTWEWMEAYGPLTADPAKIHGEWKEAIKETEARLEEWLSDAWLEKQLEATRETVGNRKAKLVRQGDGYGALDAALKAKQLGASGKERPHNYAYLDFGKTDAEQNDWVHLLNNGFFPEKCPNEVPASWMRQDEWIHLMEQAVKGADAYNWYTHMQLGASYFVLKQFDKAKAAIERSLELEVSCWALYIRGHIARAEGDKEKCAMLCLKAAFMKKDNLSLALHAAKALIAAKLYDRMVSFAEQLPEKVFSHGRIKLCYALALFHTGQLDKADALLHENGGMIVPDIREHDNPLTELWLDIEEAKAKRDNRSFDRETAKPPRILDFRMTVEK